MSNPTFSDFLKTTDQKVITPTTEILNEAVRQTYMYSSMLRGKRAGQILQGGSSLTDRVQFEDNGSFMFYTSGQELNPTTKQTLRTVTFNWRFSKADYSWNDEEVDLNEGDYKVQYKELKLSYEQGAYTSMVNGMEDALWAVPNADVMEDNDGSDAYSIPAFFDELGSTFHWPGFTNIGGLDPGIETRWRNQTQRYDPLQLDDEDEGLLTAFDRMWLKVKFDAPDTASRYFEDDNLNAMKIVTNLNGHTMYKARLRAGNDRFISPQDPAYNAPTYQGVPLKYIEALNDALLDQNALANSSVSQAWQDGEPRFMFINCKYLYPIFHSKRFMSKKGPIDGGVNMPFSHAVYFRSYYNLFCRSRQRQGIISPFAPANS